MSFETAANPDAKATAPRATVYIVDDDPSVHSSLVRLLNAYSYETKTFTSALSFLAYRTATLPDAAPPANRPAPECLVLDICMPGMDGLALQKTLALRHDPLPIVFITAHADARAATQAIEVGAVAFLSKPFDLQVMLNALETATSKSLVQAKKYIPRYD